MSDLAAKPDVSDKVQTHAESHGDSAMRGVAQDQLSQFQKDKTGNVGALNRPQEPQSGHLDFSTDIYGMGSSKTADGRSLGGPCSRDELLARSTIGTGSGAGRNDSATESGNPSAEKNAVAGSNPQSGAPGDTKSSATGPEHKGSELKTEGGRESGPFSEGPEKNKSDGHSGEAVGPSRIRVGEANERRGDGKNERESAKEAPESKEKEELDKESSNMIETAAKTTEYTEKGVTVANGGVGMLSKAGENAGNAMKTIAGMSDKVAPALEGLEKVGKFAPPVAAGLYVGAGVYEAANGNVEGGIKKTASGLGAVGAGVACAEVGMAGGLIVSAGAGLACGFAGEKAVDKLMDKAHEFSKEYVAATHLHEEAQAANQRFHQAMDANRPHVRIKEK